MKATLRNLLLPAAFLGMGVSAFAITPRLTLCSTLETGRYNLFTLWGGFVGFWVLVALGLVVLGGILIYKGRGKELPDILPSVILGVVIAAGIAFAWFGFLLPYRRPCIGAFVWLYVGWGAVALIVIAVMKPVWLARAGGIVFGVVLGLALLEGGVRLFEGPEQRSRKLIQDASPEQPIYDVLFVQPDPYVGWIKVPNFEFVWAGNDVECVEYRVNVKTNSTGFRDVEWELEKPDGTLRVAVIGDSFVEALQVPLEQTASKVLEKRLTEELNRPDVDKVEVMNVGASAYSVAQYLMVYEEYVAQYHPDYVYIFLANLHMVRTFDRDYGSRRNQAFKLNIRPTYRINENDQLEYVPALEYERFEEAIQDAIDHQYGEDRIYELYSQEDAQEFYATDPYIYLRTRSRLLNRVLPDNLVWPPKLFASEEADETAAAQPAEIAELNFRIIEELNNQVQADGGKLILVDAFLIFDNGSAGLSERSRELCEEIGAGYVNLSEPIIESDEPYDWVCDSHFNENGQRIFGDVMFEWLEEELNSGQ
ncbi:MAG: SGNH/GDSL hydrolase family protein [Anaerolineales bacterium]|nr:SGNH/GDSL hydrolase family protein [Anaerolineales bacterium]